MTSSTFVNAETLAIRCSICRCKSLVAVNEVDAASATRSFVRSISALLRSMTAKDAICSRVAFATYAATLVAKSTAPRTWQERSPTVVAASAVALAM